MAKLLYWVVEGLRLFIFQPKQNVSVLNFSAARPALILHLAAVEAHRALSPCNF
jgi:hypothetical protein